MRVRLPSLTQNHAGCTFTVSQGKSWVQYIEFELENKAYDKVQTLFTRCLRTTPYIDLWKLYLNYIRRANSESAGVAADVAQRTVAEAFEFVLTHVGLDVESSTIWQDYLTFIKSWPV